MYFASKYIIQGLIMNNNTSNKNDQGIEPAMVVIMIIAAFGLIGLISDISEAMRETKRKRAEADAWRYENIQKGADEYNRNHSSNTYINYNSNSKKTASTTSTSKSYSTQNNKTKKTTTTATNTKTVDPMNHDIDLYYEDYKEEFEDEDDAWDDFEDNEEYWDEY